MLLFFRRSHTIYETLDVSMHADGQFEVTSWEEDAYDGFGENGKLTHARVEQTFRGDIEGKGRSST